jgi:adenine phosphoribosyltransferase
MNNCIQIKKSIRTIPDFPASGIMFRDISTLMKDNISYRKACGCLVAEAEKLLPFDYVVGVEARGFIFGAVIAEKLNVGFIPVRKPGKLPAEVISMEYELEYGRDRIEVHKDAVQDGSIYILVDDLLATGGTAEAACQLVEKGGGKVAACVFLIELPELGGRIKLKGRKVVSIIEFEGE